MAEQQTDRRTGDSEIRDLRDDRDGREPRIERLSKRAVALPCLDRLTEALERGSR